MPARSLAILHLTPLRGNTGGHRMNRLMYDLLARHFEVREYAFAGGGPASSTLYYPLYPLARPLADGLRARFDVVFGEWCGFFPVATDLTYLAPPTPPAGTVVPLRRLMGVGPRPAAGTWPPPLEWLYFNPLVRPLFDRAALDALARTPTLVATSKYIQSEIRRDLGRESRVIYPAIAANDLDRLVRLQVRPRSPRVLVIGRIVPQKNLEDVLAIANGLPNVPFAIVGYVPAQGTFYLEKLRAQNPAGNVEFYPNLAEDAKQDLLGRSSVFLNPSRNDTLVIALLEAMAAGLAPVAHRSGGPLEYLAPDQTYRTTEEGIQAVRAALEGRTPTPRSESAERARHILDPARLEREIVQAVEDAYVARRR